MLAISLITALLVGCSQPCDPGYGKAADGVCYPILMPGDTAEPDGGAGEGGSSDGGSSDGGSADGGAGDGGSSDGGSSDGGSSDGGSSDGGSSDGGSSDDAGISGIISLGQDVDISAYTDLVIEAWPEHLISDGWPDTSSGDFPALATRVTLVPGEPSYTYEALSEFEVPGEGFAVLPVAYLGGDDGPDYDGPRGAYAGGIITVLPGGVTTGIDIDLDIR